jgi:hypothetical protein
MGLSPLLGSPTIKTSTRQFGFAASSESAIKSEISLTSARRSKNNHAPDRFALSHQRESLIDVAERHRLGDHRVDLDSSLHVPIDVSGTSLRPRAPPKAVPRQARPVTSWNGRVEIS